MNDKSRNKPATPRKKEPPAAPATKTSKLATSIKAAVKNIATFGDTDIFPFSFEQHIFHDQPTLIQNALELIHADFEAQLAQNPPDNINTLV